MFNIKLATLALLTTLGLGGCASAITAGVSGGDASLREKGSSMPMGISMTEKLAPPPATKLPIKITNWAQMPKEQREILKDYVYDRGDYIPVTVTPTFHGMPGMKSGFGGGKMYFEGVQDKSYNLVMTDWREKSVILLELPGNGTCSYFRKTDIGDMNNDTSYIHTSMAIADHNASVDLLNKLIANKEKINSFHKEYLKTKDNF